MIGSGNRERLMLQTPTCGPDNIMGCCQAGCTVTGTAAATYGGGSCSMGGTFACNAGALTFTSSSTACGGSFACGNTNQTVTLDLNCGATNHIGPITAQLSCDATGICTTQTSYSSLAELTLPTPSCTVAGNRTDCMFGIWSYGVAPEKRFTSVAEAKVFDGNRFTDKPGYLGCGAIGTCSVVDSSSADASSTGVACRDGSPKCGGIVGDPGWKICYGKYCETGTCSGAGGTPPWCDERTASGATGLFDCVTWSSFRPTGASGSTNPCTQSNARPTATSYMADFVSGLPTANCAASISGSSYVRASTRTVYAAPHEASRRVVVSPTGAVSYSALTDDDSGQKKHTFGQRASASEALYWLEVPKAVHTCRHADSTTCE
jgi:type IV pilus assembly protein PilY1